MPTTTATPATEPPACSHLHVPRAATVVRTAAPRLVQCTVVPFVITVVCVSWLGFWAAVAAGTAWMYGLVGWHRFRHRAVPALLVLAAVGITVRLGAVLAVGDARMYFVQPALTSGAIGMAFLGSAAVGRPVVRSMAVDFWPDLGQVAQHHAIAPAFRGLTVVWGVTQLLHGLGTIALAFTVAPSHALAVRAVGGPMLTGAAVAGSVIWMWTALRGAGLLRRHTCAT